MDERVLRAKYLDWSSAQVADYFLALSPDDIFELAERASRGSHEPSGRSLAASVEEEGLSAYRMLVERVTEVLAAQMNLPTFDEWLELYRADPAAVDDQLLGFWRDQI